MQKNFSIYISHASSDLEKAKTLVKHLTPLERNSGVEISYWGSIKPGANINKDTYDRIRTAHLIICLISADYLAFCNDEIEIIKSSNCYNNERVIPVPISNCLWKEEFGTLMPLPRDSNYQKSPFDDSGFWHEISFGVKQYLEGNKDKKRRYIHVMPARADSTSIEQSQEIPPEPFMEIPLHHDEIWIPIRGNSMSPIFEDGDSAIGKQIDREDITFRKIQTKKIFVIRTKTNGTFIKYIRSITNSKIVLASHNVAHKDITLDGSEIESIFLVVRSIKIRSEL